MARKILFVDDEEELRSMVIEYFKFLGHEFWPAANAAEALRVADKTPLDVIILDLNLGGKTDTSLLTKLNTKCPGVPVILYTGMLSDDDDVKAMLAAGKNIHYLHKDGSLGELAKVVQRVAA